MVFETLAHILFMKPDFPSDKVLTYFTSEILPCYELRFITGRCRNTISSFLLRKIMVFYSEKNAIGYIFAVGRKPSR